MTESNAKNEQPEEPKREFSQEQYDMLLRCSEKEDMIEWNEWRKANPNVEIRLQGANLRRANLQGAFLSKANLEGAGLQHAHLENAFLNRAHLEGAILQGANMQGARLFQAKLQRADLRLADLQGANLMDVRLERSMLSLANLQGVDLSYTELRSAGLQGADLGGARVFETDLRGAALSSAMVDRGTLLWNCKIDKDTDFTGVALDSARVHPGLKQLLEYNIRRLGWKEWYKKHSLRRWPTQMFWEISDYGTSTLRIIRVFFEFAVLFALIYFCWPGCVVGLQDRIAVGDFRAFVHALYFSVVTMTTLGFGDIHANPDNWVGQILLMAQVLLGYVLLAALVTRFAVLFQAGGPAGKFARKDKE